MLRHPLKAIHRNWLTPDTFELRVERPAGFAFIPGQKVRFIQEDIQRDYTLINAPQDVQLALLVRHIPNGRFSPLLARADKTQVFTVEGPFGYFAFHPSSRPAIWVATGTGIAPFIAFARSGRHCRMLLHGVREPSELYFREELIRAAHLYTGCISGADVPADCFGGRVTDYLEHHLPAERCDFYLCGRMEMIAAAMDIIDRKFEGSHVFTEIFF